MNMTKSVTWFGIVLATVTLGTTAGWAQAQPPATSVGPGRITCGNAKSCELTIGTPVSLRYKIDPAALAAADRERLAKCTAKGAPCIATVTGAEEKTGVKAASIKFFN